MHGLGRVFNVVYTASGLNIPLSKQATAVSFITADAGSGDQVLTLTQTDSTGVNGEIALNVKADSAYIGPDTGGTWTAGPAPVAGVWTMVASTNDVGVITVHASHLADGYDQVQATVAGGTCVALVHDLLVQRKPSNLATNVGT